MAATKMLSVPQLPFLFRSLSLSASSKNVYRERVIIKKLGLPQKPKRPLNGYFSYIADKRASVVAQNPDLSFSELSKLMSKNWKELPERERQKYDTEFQERLKQYKAEVKEFNECLTERQRSEMNELLKGFKVAQKEKSVLNQVKKLEKEMNKPKRPATPFTLFCSKQADNYKGIPSSQRLKLIGEKWRGLSDNEREKYKAIFRKENEQYKKLLDKWEQQMMQQGNVDLIRLKALKEKFEFGSTKK